MPARRGNEKKWEKFPDALNAQKSAESGELSSGKALVKGLHVQGDIIMHLLCQDAESCRRYDINLMFLLKVCA